MDGFSGESQSGLGKGDQFLALGLHIRTIQCRGEHCSPVWFVYYRTVNTSQVTFG